MKYWANEEEKLKFEDKIKNNEKAYQEELNAKYNVDNLFKQKDFGNKEELPTVIKQKSFLQKIIDKIKNIFRR